VSRRPRAGSTLVTAVAVLRLLEMVLELVAHEGTGESAHDAVAAGLVSAKIASGASTESAHESTVALTLHGGISGAVLLLARLAVCVLALRVLVLAVRALLGELVLRLRAGVLLLAVLAAQELEQILQSLDAKDLPLMLLLLLVAILAYLLLAMLKAALGRRAILLVVALLLAAVTLAVALLWWVSLLLLLLVLVAALVVALLGVGALGLLGVLLVLVVALVVLVVGAGHDGGDV
jgi:hypothetical protein